MSPHAYCYNADIVEILVQALVEERFIEPIQIIVRPHPINYMNDVHSDVYRMQALLERSPHVRFSIPQVLPRTTMDLPWTEVEQMARLINGSDIVVNLFSTMQLEAALADKPVINVAFDPGPVLPNQKSLAEIETNYHIARLVQTGGVRLARSTPDLLAQINQYLVDPTLDRQGRKAIVQQECEPLDGRSAQHIAEFILAVAKGSVAPRLKQRS
jgi:CDP-glycerol glycerophosphotransferase (TagB/SpsB family)